MATAIQPAPWAHPRVIAHRGAGRLAPENTLAALRLGFSLGHRAVEFDARTSGDAVAVLMHDARLERTTDGRGMLAAAPSDELARLDAGAWHSAPYTGEPVPTLERAARWCVANDVFANIEIKAGAASVASEAARHWRGARIPPLLSSFSAEALASARAAAPAVSRALLAEAATVAGEGLATTVARAQALGATALVLEREALQGDAGACVELVRRAGLHLLAWTVDDPAEAAALLAAGVDAVITDAVDRIPPG